MLRPKKHNDHNRKSTESDSSFQLWVPKPDKMHKKRKSKQQKYILLAPSGDEERIDEGENSDNEEVFNLESEQRQSLLLPSIISRSRIGREKVSRSIALPDSGNQRNTYYMRNSSKFVTPMKQVDRPVLERTIQGKRRESTLPAMLDSMTRNSNGLA